MNRPVQEVRIQSIRKLSGRKRAWTVRWVVDGKPQWKGFETEALATRYRSRLVIARDEGERFDINTGEPFSWAPQGARTPVYDWGRQWLAESWDELAPRTRRSYVEAVSRLVTLAVPSDAAECPRGTWVYLAKVLGPGGEPDEDDPRERWLRRWGLTLGQLDKAVLAEVDRKLGLGANGQRLGPRFAGRIRKTARSCIRRAYELERIPTFPWPEPTRGRERRKANRVDQAIDVRRLPAPPVMAEILEAMPLRRDSSVRRLWQVMSAVGYYAGLRPSEVAYLKARHVHLPHRPAGGWGVIEVQEVDDGEGQATTPKTGYRLVPAPPDLTEWLHTWREGRQLLGDDFLFQTERGELPALDVWGRALAKGCKAAMATDATGQPIKLTAYDLRHACATTWLKAGVPLGEAAHRLGHSVQTLVAHYVQALSDDQKVANQRIEAALDPACRPS